MKKGGKNIFTYLLAMVLSAWATFTFLLVGGMYEASDTYDQNQEVQKLHGIMQGRCGRWMEGKNV